MGKQLVVVLDTCALLYLTLQPDRLSQPAHDQFQANGGLVLSISFWEIGLKVQKRELQLPVPLDEYVQTVSNLAEIQVLPVETKHWLDSLELLWDHRDPVDRLITAYAKNNHRTLLTTDRQMLAFYDLALG